MGSVVQIVKDHYNDKRLGIETSWSYYLKGNISSYDGDVSYQPTPYARIGEIIDYLKLSDDDVFVDLGSGKGRVIFLVARQNIKKVIGVEKDEELSSIAKVNLNNRKYNTPVKIINCDAADFDCKEGTVFFMFNPFGYKTITKIIDNIKESLKDKPRKIRIVYLQPMHRYILESQDWLELEGKVGNENCLVWRNRYNRYY